jgi:Acyl-ACP thioesterase
MTPTATEIWFAKSALINSIIALISKRRNFPTLFSFIKHQLIFPKIKFHIIKRKMKQYTRIYRIENNDMDYQYRMTPKAVSMLFQDCFATYMAMHHIAAFDICKQNLIWVISEFSVRFENEMPFWSEEIEVNAWVSEITSIRLYWEFRLTYKGSVFAEGDSAWAILNTETRHPIQMEDLTSTIPTSERQIFTTHKHKIAESGEKINEYLYTIKLRDTDFNFHTNNITYMQIIMESLFKKYSEKHSLKHFIIKFLHESFCDDNLICQQFTTNVPEQFIFNIKRDNNVICAASALFEDKTSSTSIETFDLNIRKK